ncbi:MAG: valine--tRNA ligase [bacterium]|nr:valine--tRNA ligase [bacterium]
MQAKELAPAYSPKDTEEKIYQAWEESGYFNPDNLPPPTAEQAGNRKKTYTIAVPPPNVTGSLHMGHALNATIQDILIRKKRMEGYKTLWLPGTDHAGIATQNVVEKDLKKQGLTRHDLGREKFLEKVWEWKEKYGDIILNQFKKLGSSMDWSRTRFTMDEGYQKAVEQAFHHYHKKGRLYKAEKVINWCTRCQTSLSDLELEYKEEAGKLWYIRYPLSEVKGEKLKVKSEYVVVATTRPETMLGDSAVAVNPDDKRYQGLIGKKVLLPIMNREIPIISDEEIDATFGTGAVKVTPAHDLLDARIGEKNNLPIYKVIGQLGKMTEEAGAGFAGLKIAEAREKVVAELKNQNLIEKEENYQHNVAVCYRCGGVVEPLPSLQWFLKMEELAKLAMDAVKSGKIKFHPQSWEKVYFAWLENVRDWNISRQIWWGHQIPVFYCSKKLEKFKVKSLKFKVDEEYFIVADKKPKQCPICKECEMVQDTDVLDTWFSSALWPFATLGWPEKTKDLKEFYPTQVLSTARDIINLWVSRMIFSGLELAGEKPFTDVIIHGTILTKEGRRMSKSLGTGIDPMVLIEKYGADATRFGLIWQAMGNQDIHWDEAAVMAGKKFANKVWNIARFVLQQTSLTNDPRPTTNGHQKEDKEILEKLAETKKAVESGIDNYDFGPALHTLYDFVWHELADKYIESSKQRQDEGAQQTLNYVLLEVLKMLHPFMPHLTEEIYQDLSGKKQDFLMVETW